MGASGVAVATTFGIQICLAIVVFLLFSRLRLAGFARRFYAPKLFDSTVPPEKKPRRLPPGLFSWMGVVFNYPETDLIKSAGLDAAIYLRVLSFGWEVFVKVSLITCIIILPINLSGDRVDQLLAEQAAEEAANNPSPAPARLLLHTATRLARHLLQAAAETSPPLSPSPSPSPNSVEVKKYSFTTFDKCSLANLPPSSHKFWAHMVAVYVVTYLILTALSRFNAQATLLRLAYLANAPRGGPSHTVLVTDVPGMRYGTLVWYLRGLAGSTLFVLLPAKWKKKVLDTVESGFQVVGAITSADVGAQLRRDKARNAAAAAEKPVPLEITAMAKAAEANTREAEEVEASKQKKASGVIRARKRKPGSEILAADESLDPWYQAKEALGDANDPSPELVEKFVQDEIEGTYGKHCVAAVNPVWDQRELNPLLGEYAAIRQQLEDYLDLCASKLKRKQPIKKRQKVTVLGPRMGSWGIREYGMKAQKVDAIEFWSKRLRYLAQEIPKAQQRGLDRAIPACFVTVNSRATQVTMSTTLHHHDETTWQIQGAPEPKEVIWGSLPMRRWERSLRTVALWAVYVVLLCFYMIPITAMQGLINVPKLATVPVLGDIVNLPVIKQLLEGIVPGLVLVIFLAVLPAILALFCRLSGFVSTSQVDFGVTTRYFYFQVVALFLGSLVAGSLFNQLQQFAQQPTSLITILGSAIPGTAAFFINYILVAGIGRSGINHLRIVGLIILWLKAKAAATKRARDRVWSDQTILYGPNVPNYTIYFLLGLVYCCVNPIIAPTVLLFYSFAIISDRYNLLYVYKSEYESGGRLWYYVFNQFMIGMYFFQIFMLVLLLLKKFVWAVLLIPAPIITLAYHITNLKLHGRPWRVMSAHDAAMLDRMDQEEQGTDEVTPAEKKLIQEMYLSPAFNFPSEEVQKLLQEAEVVSNAIDGKGTTKDIEADDDFQNAQEMWGEEADVEARPSQASTSTNGDVALKNLKLDSGPLAGGQASGSGASSLVDPTDVKPRIKRG